MRLDYTKIKVLQDAFVSLLNNPFLSDIKFKFSDGRIIFAHSFVLCCRSDEFCDSFETTVGVSKLIQVENATYDEYFQFLKYLYTDSCNIDQCSLTSVIQLSKKHELPGLEAKCIDGVLEDMNVENVCTVLEKSIELELQNLRVQSTKFIAENYIAALNAESFLKIREEALKAILELEPVSDNDEMKVFNATMKWAEKACLKDGLEASGSLKRQKLGDNLKLLRFGAMTCAEFTTCIKLVPDVLSKDEKLSIFINLSSGEKNSFGFATEKRQLIIKNFVDKLVLYDNVANDKKWVLNSNVLESNNSIFTFSVSQSIAIEDIVWRIKTGITMIQFLENSTTIYEGPNFSGVVNSKKMLNAETRYTINLSFPCKLKWNCLNTDLKLQSESGKSEFTVYKNSSRIIENLEFKS